jgi:5-methyltetrahydrofolate--homocysteine methyltransferase
MLREMIDKDLIDCRGVVGFYPCNSNSEDDIEIYEEDGQTLKTRLFTLRQ